MRCPIAARAQIVISEDILAGVDRLVGQRQRSKFIEEAVEERLRRERQAKALRKSFGVLKAEDYPEWSTPEQISVRVANLRRQAIEMEEHELGRRADEWRAT